MVDIQISFLYEEAAALLPGTVPDLHFLQALPAAQASAVPAADKNHPYVADYHAFSAEDMLPMW